MDLSGEVPGSGGEGSGALFSCSEGSSMPGVLGAWRFASRALFRQLRISDIKHACCCRHHRIWSRVLLHRAMPCLVLPHFSVLPLQGGSPILEGLKRC